MSDADRRPLADRQYCLNGPAYRHAAEHKVAGRGIDHPLEDPNHRRGVCRYCGDKIERAHDRSSAWASVT